MQVPGVVGTRGGDGAVGVQGDGPAPAMDRDQAVKTTQKQQIGKTVRSACGTGDEVMWLTGGRPLVAAREPATSVADDDGPAQVRRDGIGSGADIQQQAGEDAAPAVRPVRR